MTTTTTTTARIDAGANHTELCELRARWSRTVEDTPTGLLDAAALADTAAAFEDMLANLDPTNPDDRHTRTAEDLAPDFGLCPDSGDHLTVVCHQHGCRNYIDELHDLAPWGTSRTGLKAWTR